LPVRQSFSGKYVFLFEYDANGNPIVEEQYSGDQLDNRITSEYDANNRLVLEEQMKMSRRYEYEFYD
jgi:antitoxin component YwqK of YwqJK toxin-antitoxin module